jgi:predicted metal-dependent phosphoesterase TrpH
MRRWSAVLLACGIAAGTVADRLPERRALSRGGYVVLQADLHVHSFLGDGTLWPWDVALEARRHGLDAIAITNHNQTLAARMGRWLAPRLGGAMVAAGEEISAPSYHLVAVGIERTIGWREGPAAAIEEVHAQGGAAIAAHPTRSFWSGWDDAALRSLDGAEVCHPVTYYQGPEDLRAFFSRFKSNNPRGAAIGSSDYHVAGSLGLCRTFVFAKGRSERGLVEAIRAGRTVAYDARGMPHGDPGLVALLGTRTDPPDDPPAQAFLALAGRICALAGIAGLCLFRSAKRR